MQHVRGPATSWGQAHALWGLQDRVVLLKGLPEAPLGEGRPQAGVPAAAGAKLKHFIITFRHSGNESTAANSSTTVLLNVNAII